MRKKAADIGLAVLFFYPAFGEKGRKAAVNSRIA
jgi:hypothetical protein